MVDFKFLTLKPPVKSSLVQRRCRRASSGGGNVRAAPCESPQCHMKLVAQTEAAEEMPKIKKKYIVIFLVLVLACLALGLVFYLKSPWATGEATIRLVPPNPTKPLPASSSTLHRFRKAAVCVDAPICAEIGRNILAKNGSAVDATVATMICNGVVTMQSMGLGGGFLMTVYIKSENKSYTLNAREKAPLAARPDMFNTDKSSQVGPLAIAVPGELKGYWTAHQKFGKLPWKDLIQPTVELCENGYNISRHQHSSLHMGSPSVNDSNFNEWFRYKNGTFKPQGAKVVPKKLCETLRIVAEKGGDDLYNGTLATKLLEDIEEFHGLITKEDLTSYTAEWVQPISVKLRNGHTLISIPPPGSGAILSFIMNILDGYKFDGSNIDGVEETVKTYHKIIEAFKYAYAKRTELADMSFVDIKDLIRNLTSSDYADSIRQKIRENSTSPHPEDYGAVFSNREDHGTAHASILAENGDAVSITSSINIYFGAGLTSKQTGIILNSVMDDFSLEGKKNYFGLPPSPNNRLEPGKRPLSSMSPSILLDENNDVKMVIGASGGTKITMAVAWVIMRTLWFGEDIKTAIDAPRIHHQLYPMEIQYEYGTLQQYVNGLEALGHNTTRVDPASIVCALMKKNKVIEANADHRKGGDVYGIEEL